MAEEKIKIVIMTSNGLRHRYFANFLTSQFNVLGIVSEAQKPPGNQSDRTLQSPLLLARVDTNDAPGGKFPLFSIKGEELTLKEPLKLFREKI